MNKIYDTNSDFSFAMDISKSYAIYESGDDDNIVMTDMMIKGVASSTRKDLQGDQFSRDGLESIREAIENGIENADGERVRVPLLSGHKPEWEDVIGEIVKAEIDNEDNLWITARLDEDSNKAQELYRKLSKKKVKLGLSVKGTVTKYKLKWDEVLNKQFPIFDNLLVKEISVTQQPVNPSPYPLAIAKSLRDDPNYAIALEENMTEVTKSGEDTFVHPAQADNNTELKNVEGEVAAEQNENAAEAANVELSNENIEEVVENTTLETSEAPAEPQRVSDVPAEDSNANDVPEGYVAHPQSGSDTQDAPTQEVTTDPASADPVQKLTSTLNELLEQIRSAQSELETLKAKNEPVETQKAMTAETATLDADLDTRIATAVAKAFETVGINALVKEVEVMKSSVESLSAQPADRSISVSKAKDEQDANDPVVRYKELIDSGLDPLTAAMSAAYKRK